MAGADRLLDRLDELFTILLGGHMILFILPKCLTPAECTFEPHEEVRLSFGEMSDERLQYTLVSQHPALKIGVFDCHKVRTFRSRDAVRCTPLRRSHFTGKRLIGKSQSKFSGSSFRPAKDARAAEWQTSGRKEGDITRATQVHRILFGHSQID